MLRKLGVGYADWHKHVLVTDADGDEYIIFVSIEYDEWPEDPGEWGDGSIMSFSRRDRNHISPSDMESLMDDGVEMVPLGYSEHGICQWYPASDGDRGGWDRTAFAGIFVPSEDLLEYAADSGDKRVYLREQADLFCEAYTSWCNGTVQTYKIKVYAYREPYDEPNDYRFSGVEYYNGGSYYHDGYIEEDFMASLNTAVAAVGSGDIFEL